LAAEKPLCIPRDVVMNWDVASGFTVAGGAVA
jgi:hypothetical protein